MIQRAIRKAFPDKADCIIHVVLLSGITEVGELGNLSSKLGGAPSVCGINIGVLAAKAMEASASIDLPGEPEVKLAVAPPPPDELEMLVGIDEKHIDTLRSAGIMTISGIIEAGDGLTDLPGIGKKTAASVLDAANSIQGEW